MEKEKMLNEQELESVSGGSGVPKFIYTGTIQSVSKDKYYYIVYVPKTDGCYKAYSSRKNIPVGTQVQIRCNDKLGWCIL